MAFGVGDRLASASSDTGSGAYLAPQAQTQPAAAATPARCMSFICKEASFHQFQEAM